MDHTFWHKQTTTPLFPDILWSRPESKATAGKLCIIGGNAHGFSAPAKSYTVAMQNGIGVVRILLPEAIKKIVHSLLPEADYVPSTPSGSFARNALDEFLRVATWSDGVLIAGDVGRNSETAMLLESFVTHYPGLLTITQDALDYFRESPLQLVDRENTLIVATIAQLQKIFIFTPTITPITFGMSTLQLADALHHYTLDHSAVIMTKHNDLLFVARNGQVSTTKHESEFWRTEMSTRASVFWLQNRTKSFESITTSLLTDSERT